MNQKILVALAIIIAVVLFLVFSGQNNKNESGEEFIAADSGDEYNPSDFTDPATLGSQENIVVEPVGFEAAKTSADCDKKTGFFRDSCYYNLAKIKNDFSYCNTISGQNLNSKDGCFYDIALQERNGELCKKMVFGIPDCLTDIALETLDPSFCEQAGFEKSNCVKAVNGNDFSFCEKLGIVRWVCSEAIETKNSSLCDQITDASEYCFEELALKTNNAEYCKRVASDQEYCYNSIAVATNNYRVCDLLKERRDLCVAQIAFNTKNRSLCELAGSERDSCIADLQ